eukprot:419440_1
MVPVFKCFWYLMIIWLESFAYEYIDQHMNKANWYEAEIACLTKYGSHLATINSATDNSAARDICKYIKTNTNHAYCSCWFGVNNINNNQKYCYPNNYNNYGTQSISYSNWETVSTSSNQCAWFVGSKCSDVNIYWENSDCSQATAAATVCNDNGTANLDTKHINLQTGYIAVQQKMSWFDAEDYCLSNYKSHLATIGSAQQNEEIIYIQHSLLSNDRTYIGLYENKWIDTSDLSSVYRNWYYAAFPDISSTCGYLDFLHYGFWWKNTICGQMYASVCNPVNSASDELTTTTNNNKYILVEKLHSWYSGEDYCYFKYNSHLATMTTLTDTFAVSDLCRSSDNTNFNCWFGTIHNENEWINPSFDSLNYSYWYLSSSSYSNNKGDCGYVTSTGNSRHWLSSQCTDINYIFICNPLNSLSLNDRPTNKKYIAVNLWFNWTDADLYCQQHYGSHLATIRNENENNEIGNVCRGLGLDSDCWIGLNKNDLDSDFRFRWKEDGSLMNYTKWFDGQPAFTNNDVVCGYIDSLNDNHGRYWMADDDCSFKKYFICNPATFSIETSDQPISTHQTDSIASIHSTDLIQSSLSYQIINQTDQENANSNATTTVLSKFLTIFLVCMGLCILISVAVGYFVYQKNNKLKQQTYNHLIESHENEVNLKGEKK